MRRFGTVLRWIAIIPVVLLTLAASIPAFAFAYAALGGALATGIVEGVKYSGACAVCAGALVVPVRQWFKAAVCIAASEMWSLYT